MSEKKRYSAQEMRNMQMYVTCLNKDQERTIKSMLRQAADDGEELDNLRKATRVEVHFDGAEVNEKLALRCEVLRNRLAAVVKYATENSWDDRSKKGVETETCTRIHNICLDEIVKIANGDK